MNKDKTQFEDVKNSAPGIPSPCMGVQIYIAINILNYLTGQCKDILSSNKTHLRCFGHLLRAGELRVQLAPDRFPPPMRLTNRLQVLGKIESTMIPVLEL
ncbi:uncharacterized protein BJX67DRAFT_75825 [Aspergillus lucknowensis]|uniref:Uncharacterized protein n=1 Tax=Aspergillus lucknowensis TaxID=176173 RepID=A0ABR4LT54_9EURO